jgi:hypothetical protein
MTTQERHEQKQDWDSRKRDQRNAVLFHRENLTETERPNRSGISAGV